MSRSVLLLLHLVVVGVANLEVGVAYLVCNVILLFVVLFQTEFWQCAAAAPGGGRGLPSSGRGLPSSGRGLTSSGRGLPGRGRGLPGAPCDTEHCILLCFRLMSRSALLLLPLLVVGVAYLVQHVSGCNEAVCASMVSKCMLLKMCECDMQDKANCTCCKDCHKCLAMLYTECCSCVGK